MDRTTEEVRKKAKEFHVFLENPEGHKGDQATFLIAYVPSVFKYEKPVEKMTQEEKNGYWDLLEKMQHYLKTGEHLVTDEEG